jgi:hypothetical protein
MLFVSTLQLAGSDEMFLGGDGSLKEEQSPNPVMQFLSEQGGMMWLLRCPDELKFVLEHPAGGPAPAYLFRMRIKASEVFSQGASASFLHSNCEGVNVCLDLSEIFVFFGLFCLFAI